jgi:UDP-glucose 4-epimerase
MRKDAMMKGKKILITGGAGFIGSNLAKRLVLEGADVTLLDSFIPEYGGNLENLVDIRDKVTLNIADVRDPFSMKYLVQGQDIIFNLAGQTSHLDSMQNPFPDLEINARAQLSILEAVRQSNPSVRIVFASTRQVYGAPQYLPVNEDHPLNPVDVNGINKLAGEWYHILYNNVYGIKTSVLRLTNTYGPCMRVKDARQTFLGIWIKRLLEGEPILVYGDGKQIRDLNYVDDVVEAMLLALSDKAVGKIYNLGSEEKVNLLDLADLLIAQSADGKKEIVPFPDNLKRIDIGDYYGDFKKIKEELGWSPAIGLAEGLKRSVEYYREHGREYGVNI